MAISAKLEFRQGQQLVMTPQLQQAIRLLQLSNIELNAFVEAELERNPLLEREEAEPEPVARSIDQSADKEPAAFETSASDAPDLDFNQSDVDYTSSHDTDLENIYPEAPLSDFGPEQLGSWSSLSQSSGSSGASTSSSFSDGEHPDLEVLRF